MKIWITLSMHELRNARSSLAAAALLTVALLAILHIFDCTPTETATGLPLLWCLCALQFAADSFATDLASRRLATRAALPVGARALWGTKLGSFVMSIALLSGFGIALECTWQAVFGDQGSRLFFIQDLPTIGKALTALALIGSTGMLCSLLVESALTAMLLTSLLLGVLWGLSLAIAETVKLIGPNALSEHPVVVALAIAAIFLLIGYVAFARSQSRLGDAAIRIRAVLVGALVLTLGIAGTAAATSTYWSTYGLEDPRTDIFPPIASPDGRFIAFETMPSGGARDVRLTSVWVLDLKTREHRLIAGPGMLVRKTFGGWEAWSEEEGLYVLSFDRWLFGRKPETLRIRAIDGELHQESIADMPLVTTPRLPDWALVKETRLNKRDVRAVCVQWKERQVERIFEGRLGHDVFISPTPGRVIVRRDKQLVLVDLEPAAERTLIDEGVVYVSVSPDSLALLAHSSESSRKWTTHVISTADGMAMHAPWTQEDRYMPGWISGDDRSHELHLGPMKRGLKPRILDLDLDREIEIDDTNNLFFARVADRGYAMVDLQQNLVWIDRDGKPVRVLIDRSGRR
jgi:hypothetical protein